MGQNSRRGRLLINRREVYLIPVGLRVVDGVSCRRAEISPRVHVLLNSVMDAACSGIGFEAVWVGSG